MFFYQICTFEKYFRKKRKKTLIFYRVCATIYRAILVFNAKRLTAFCFKL